MAPPSGKQWYDKCPKAPWQPPKFVFGLVWPILYALYGLLIWLTWGNSEARTFLLLGLALNLCWVPLFTVNAQAAFLLLLTMVLVGIKTIQVLYKGNKNHAYLFAPYLAWISFASTLNAYSAFTC